MRIRAATPVRWLPRPGSELAPAASPGEDAVTPVPPTAPAGEVKGVPLLVGGADLEDSLATLVAYQGKDGVHEVLYATVAEDAEAKLVEALSLSEEKLVPVVVEKTIDGRLPLDTENKLFEQLETVAKSVNNHLKAQDAIPAHTLANLEKVGRHPPGAKDRRADGGGRVRCWTATRRPLRASISGSRIPKRFPMTRGGKVPLVEPHEVSQLVAVTEYVPAPAGETPENLRPAQVRDATRVAPKLDAAGVASWDGKARSKASGKEYSVDLGDGYRPCTGPMRPLARRRLTSPPGCPRRCGTTRCWPRPGARGQAWGAQPGEPAAFQGRGGVGLSAAQRLGAAAGPPQGRRRGDGRGSRARRRRH